MTPAEIDAATGQCVVRAANLLIGAFNQETHYLRKVELHAALVHLRRVGLDAMPGANITIPEVPVE